MRKLFAKLWEDDGGTLLAIEFLFMAVILGIGGIVGYVALRNALATEFTELANAILALSPAYSFGDLSGCCSSVQGTQVIFIPTQLPCPTCGPATNVVTVTCPPPCP